MCTTVVIQEPRQSSSAPLHIGSITDGREYCTFVTVTAYIALTLASGPSRIKYSCGTPYTPPHSS